MSGGSRGGLCSIISGLYAHVNDSLLMLCQLHVVYNTG
jgi:hypothetical protein